MRTLGIETSCDETSCAVYRAFPAAPGGGSAPKDELLSNIVSSSLFRHKAFGGVVPEIASRHALEQIDTVLKEALETARVALDEIDLIAVTHGPGLIGSLFVGVSFAKALAYRLKKPLIGVNHLEAHLAANFISREEPESYIGLLVSGGHTCLIHRGSGSGPAGPDPVLLGETVDDAAGEAFDKVAKLLGLGYPGGPVIEKMAQDGDPAKYKFTCPKQDQRFGFSFSGIKTAVRLLVEKQREEGRGKRDVASRQPPYREFLEPRRQSPCSQHVGDLQGHHGQYSNKGESRAQEETEENLRSMDGQTLPTSHFPLPTSFVCDVAASFQHAVVGWLVTKTMDAAECKDVRDIVVGGGVSANGSLKERLEAKAAEKGIRVWFPPKALTIDNAGMIARRGWELYQKGVRSPMTLTAVPNLALTVQKE